MWGGLLRMGAIMREIVRRAVALLLLNYLLCGAATADTLRVGGTGGALDMVGHVGAAFTSAGGDKVDIALSLGSNGALRALADGVLDIAVTARPLTSEETKPGFAIVPVARTPLVFATSYRGPDDFASADLARIFASSKPTWRDGSPIRIVLRTRLDADTMLISDLFPGLREAIAMARQRPDLPVAATDQDNTKLAEALQGSLIVAGLSQIEMEKRDLRYLKINGATPSIANLESGAYPYEKMFYLVLPARRSAVAQRFLDFVHTGKGRMALRESGTLPVEE
jgi:phosphate transport system substrate-binding protein